MTTFNNMNYKKIYNNLIAKAKLEVRVKSFETYYEAHHIKPKSFGGEGDCRNTKHPNIVLLTPKEHYIAHLLLVAIYPDSPAMKKALWSMCNTGKEKRYKPSAKIFEKIRLDYIKSVKGEGGTFYGKKHTIESLIKIGKASLGRKAHLGKKHTNETKDKIRISKLGKPLKSETINKIKLATSGGNHYNAKTVVCLVTGRTFPSGKELSEYLSIPFSSVRRYLNSSSKPEWFKYKRV